MKQISWLVSLWVLALVFPGCREDESAKPGNIRFAFNPAVVTDGQGRKTTSLPDGASLYVSIRRVSGDEVYSLEPVRLLKLGDEYISEPLALPGGNYELTDFLVADGDGNVVYATPKEGSELALWVDDPLPQDFAVSDDDIAQVDVQVLPIDAQLPEQFGYVTFKIDVVPFPYFQLAVFRADSTAPVFTPAYAYLLLEGDTVYHRHLPAGNQPISFPGNPEATYTLVIQENALATYRRTFVLQDLVAELNGAPLQVVLQPALTFTALYRFDFFQFWTESMPGSSFTIDWGDGTVGEYAADDGYIEFHHIYPGSGDYHVSVSGDLDVLWRLGLVFGFGASDHIFLNALPNLRSLGTGSGYDFGADSLDLSHNPKLEALSLFYSNVRYFDISNNPRIIGLELIGSDDISTAVLDQVIADLHQHAFELSLEQGYVNLEGGESSIIGPPSPETIELLRDLKNNLGWNVVPDPY
ncbi:hypothetical protein [Parachryseolinea silvisoli]|uniref:hypothetical protein n=1 Tax=Parachryseolinea silvisoli TaxID=2873601 RepID=UPI0022659EF4|nr:hypothetical protein [Parachryseolinea silvisoli]MCD9019725.1 hypothetical protein [Parachryseolinea silvisoli]